MVAKVATAFDLAFRELKSQTFSRGLSLQSSRLQPGPLRVSEMGHHASMSSPLRLKTSSIVFGIQLTHILDAAKYFDQIESGRCYGLGIMSL